jgi:hypothetical protein
LGLHSGVHDDFRYYVDTNEWTKLAADAGSSVAAGDTENGVLALTTGATDNNEAAVRTTKKIFLVGDDKPHVFDSSLKLAEANTDDANCSSGSARRWPPTKWSITAPARPPTSRAPASTRWTARRH